jgi:hypothetical protein
MMIALYDVLIRQTCEISQHKMLSLLLFDRDIRGDSSGLDVRIHRDWSIGLCLTKAIRNQISIVPSYQVARS